jgi:hypothetical protein
MSTSVPASTNTNGIPSSEAPSKTTKLYFDFFCNELLISILCINRKGASRLKTFLIIGGVLFGVVSVVTTVTAVVITQLAKKTRSLDLLTNGSPKIINNDNTTPITV